MIRADNIDALAGITLNELSACQCWFALLFRTCLSVGAVIEPSGPMLVRVISGLPAPGVPTLAKGDLLVVGDVLIAEHENTVAGEGILDLLQCGDIERLAEIEAADLGSEERMEGVNVDHDMSLQVVVGAPLIGDIPPAD
jgi:hypothetical protein